MFAALAAALAETDPDAKIARVDALAADWRAGRLNPESPAAPLVCGRPARPVLVPPKQVPQRQPSTPEGRATLLHAIVHIEFTAINLALDHAARFPSLPAAYYGDWIGVAEEEGAHFKLLRERLHALGHDYGDFPAHGGLWAMAERTAHDALARMALVPRLLEARGLDVTPPIQAKLEQAGDQASARCLDTILADEVGHVGLGDKWFRHLCAERGLAPEETYVRLLAEFRAPPQPRPMNRDARRRAGFSESELDALETL